MWLWQIVVGCVRKSIGVSYLLFPAIHFPIEHPYQGLLRHPSRELVACYLRARMGVGVAAELVLVAGIRCIGR